MTPQILIRCDASLSIGSGHVIRCRTLARELQRRGANVTFLCRRQPGDLISLLKQEFEVLSLPEQPLAACEGLEGRELYGAWLGCSNNQDADHCMTAIASAGVRSADLLAVDHYGLDASWEAQLLNALAGDKGIPKLLAIDDLADRPHQADLLLDQNFFGAVTDQRYQGLVPSPCRLLLGPDYALLGPEYAQLHPLVPVRTEVRRMLVFFGGVDSENFTGLALEALMNPALADVAVDVILGLQSSHRSAIEEVVARRPYTTLHEPLPSLAGLIARADLAIGAGGATTWERCCLGVPSVLLACAHNQEETSEAIGKYGAAFTLYPGIKFSARMLECITVLRGDTSQYTQMSRRAHEICDGLGVSRVSREIISALGDTFDVNT